MERDHFCPGDLSQDFLACIHCVSSLIGEWFDIGLIYSRDQSIRFSGIRIWIRIQNFFNEFYHCGMASSWVRNSPIICGLADLRLNKLKAALADFCAARVLLILY